jgi:CDP-glycerol glycerophosphotransferase (TagB/SpsB family)
MMTTLVVLMQSFELAQLQSAPGPVFDLAKEDYQELFPSFLAWLEELDQYPQTELQLQKQEGRQRQCEEEHIWEVVHVLPTMQLLLPL